MTLTRSSSFSIEIPLTHKLKYNTTPFERSPAVSKVTFQPEHKEMIVNGIYSQFNGYKIFFQQSF